jgi:lysophospholipase L1-like esterase
MTNPMPQIRRVVLVLAGLVLLRLAWVGVPFAFDRLVPQGPIRRVFVSGLLWVVFAGYLTTLIVSVLTIVGLGARLARSRQPIRNRARIGRFLLLAVTGLFCLAMVEGMTLTLRHGANRMPVLPTKFQPRADSSLFAVVIGESSAYGYPYADWLSIGEVVGQGLRDAFPDRRVDVKVLAQPGATLATMQERLAWLKRKPDLMIIYSGHNEFIARYSWWRYSPYYLDEARLHPHLVLMDRAGRVSPFLGWLLEVIDRQRISGAPDTKGNLPTEIVQNPVCSPDEVAGLGDDFHRRLDAIVSYCERIGCLPVLVIPPSNDAGLEPGRTVALPSTNLEERLAIDRELRRLRLLEDDDPSQALDGYREVLDRQPTLAEAHYRVGRLLESASRLAEADQEYQLTRDRDGMPLRCLGRFHEAYRTVAAKHDTLLIDGPAVLKELSPKRLLDDHAFNDGVHPSLRGHLTLAHAILEGLRARQAFGWPLDRANPTVDALEFATWDRLGPSAWAIVCDLSARYYDRTYRIRFDPTERLAKARRFHQAAAMIRAGIPPEILRIDGIGPTPPPTISKSTEAR